MHGCAVSMLFPAHYGTHRVVPTGQFSEYRLRERGKRSRGTLVPGGVSHTPENVAEQFLNIHLCTRRI